ncbi:hypothetical protein [Paenibacillus ottowii]|nr:hypothetical protein [Paenibacillus ottowii]
MREGISGYLDQDRIAQWAKGEIMGLTKLNMVQGYLVYIVGLCGK